MWRIESGRLIAALARVTGDVGLAEELAQDALVAALEQWPQSGVPRNPGAWLTTVAKRRAIDQWRRQAAFEQRATALAAELQAADAAAGAAALASGTAPAATASTVLAGAPLSVQTRPDLAVLQPIDDELLRLIFVACHPVLGRDARIALTLRLLGGLSAEQIARAFVVPTATMQQRIVRAKKTLSAAGVPFEVPERSEFEARLDSVLAVIYLIYNEGYSASSGDDWMRPELCREALRLGRVLAELLPREPEVHGLVALMEIQSSRLGARTTREGEPILLLEQDRGRWNQLLIRRGLAALDRARRCAAARGADAGSYQLQAEIAACHARALTPDATDWAQIAGIYERLARRVPSPVVDLNRAVALSMARGPAVGLVLVDALVAEGRLSGYHLLPSVRADLLQKLGRREEAREEYERAAALAGNERDRALLLNRARALRRG
ncbi:RNA polymerase subunit sigma-24 [Microterricola viridarii]|uniref:RNA polymerase sigma factor n=1 Tax=Microterricola viridarii TaxID=412690 RepID=A0A120I199_9MICO|nr:RNA polymerase subunit sigma-24 [Microterricola viridarii]